MMLSVLLAAAAALTLAPAIAYAQSSVTPPYAFFPQKVGGDYYLANYSEDAAYLQKLAATDRYPESGRGGSWRRSNDPAPFHQGRGGRTSDRPG